MRVTADDQPSRGSLPGSLRLLLAVCVSLVPSVVLGLDAFQAWMPPPSTNRMMVLWVGAEWRACCQAAALRLETFMLEDKRSLLIGSLEWMLALLTTWQLLLQLLVVMLVTHLHQAVIMVVLGTHVSVHVAGAGGAVSAFGSGYIPGKDARSSDGASDGVTGGACDSGLAARWQWFGWRCPCSRASAGS